MFAEDTAPALVSSSPDRPNPAEGNEGGDWNVNSRYTVESVEFPDTHESSFSHRLREQIRSGRLLPGARLPSSRALGRQLGISRGVVVEAYSQLSAEGYLMPAKKGKRPPDLRYFGQSRNQ